MSRNLKLVQSWLYATPPNSLVHFTSNYYVISLYHDSVSGARYAKLNFEDIPSSQGKSSLMMQGIHKITFTVEDRPAYIEIKKQSMSSFAYKCVLDNALVPEAHRSLRASERRLFTCFVSSFVNAPSDDGSSSNAMVTYYAIETKRHDDIIAVSHRRYNEFSDLEKLLRELFKGKELPSLPQRQSKAFVDHNSQSFLEDRKGKLEQFLQDLLNDPMVAELPALSTFIGFPHANNIREISISLPLASIDRALTFTPSACQVGEYYVTAIVQMVHDPSLCGSIEVGDCVVKINGGSVSGLSFPDVITKLKKSSSKPMVIHFFQLLPVPRLSIRDSHHSRPSLEVKSAARQVEPIPPASPSMPPPPISSPPPPMAPPPTFAHESDHSAPSGPRMPAVPSDLVDEPNGDFPTPDRPPPVFSGLKSMGRRASAPMFDPPPIPQMASIELKDTYEDSESSNHDAAVEAPEVDPILPSLGVTVGRRTSAPSYEPPRIPQLDNVQLVDRYDDEEEQEEERDYGGSRVPFGFGSGPVPPPLPPPVAVDDE